jgi:hypothetical protein
MNKTTLSLLALFIIFLLGSKAVNITSCDQLLTLINTSAFRDHFLMNNLDCTGLSFTSSYRIGGATLGYTGTFDGQGFYIKGLKMTTNDYSMGFIGKLGSIGVLKNLELRDCEFEYTGGNLNVFGFHVGNSYGTIDNCKSTSNKITIVSTGYIFDIGGIVGFANTGSITRLTTTSLTLSINAASTVYEIGGNIGGLNANFLFASDLRTTNSLIRVVTTTGGLDIGGNIGGSHSSGNITNLISDQNTFETGSNSQSVGGNIGQSFQTQTNYFYSSSNNFISYGIAGGNVGTFYELSSTSKTDSIYYSSCSNTFGSNNVHGGNIGRVIIQRAITVTLNQFLSNSNVYSSNGDKYVKNLETYSGGVLVLGKCTGGTSSGFVCPGTADSSLVCYSSNSAPTTAPITTAPITTAPITTAPTTIAPITTAPTTTAPTTTVPTTTAPCNGLKGEKGDQGVKGNTGAKGEAGISVTGSQGEKGDKGVQGEKGSIGATGAKGDLGSQGIQGVAGNKGEKGEKGQSGINGARGVRGLVGSKGERGSSKAVVIREYFEPNSIEKKSDTHYVFPQALLEKTLNSSFTQFNYLSTPEGVLIDLKANAQNLLSNNKPTTTFSLSCGKERKMKSGNCLSNSYFYKVEKSYCFASHFQVDCQQKNSKNCVQSFDSESVFLDNQNKHVLSKLDYFDNQGKLVSLLNPECEVIVLAPLDLSQRSKCGKFCVPQNLEGFKKESHFVCNYSPSPVPNESSLSDQFSNVIETVSIESVCESSNEKDEALIFIERQFFI